MDVGEGSHGWDSHVIEFVAVGTGVAPIESPEHDVHAPARAVLFAQG